MIFSPSFLREARTKKIWKPLVVYAVHVHESRDTRVKRVVVFLWWLHDTNITRRFMNDITLYHRHRNKWLLAREQTLRCAPTADKTFAALFRINGIIK